LLDLLISTLRTKIPYLWGLIVSWLTAKGVLTEAAAAALTGDTAAAALVGAVLLVITTATYVVVRLVEINLPKILGKFLPADTVATVVKYVIRVLLGSSQSPTYTGSTFPPTRVT
jgi:hypothetical protein